MRCSYTVRLATQDSCMLYACSRRRPLLYICMIWLLELACLLPRDGPGAVSRKLIPAPCVTRHQSSVVMLMLSCYHITSFVGLRQAFSGGLCGCMSVRPAGEDGGGQCALPGLGAHPKVVATAPSCGVVSKEGACTNAPVSLSILLVAALNPALPASFRHAVTQALSTLQLCLVQMRSQFKHCATCCTLADPLVTSRADPGHMWCAP